MITGLHGVLVHRGHDSVIVRVGGFDLRLSVPTSGLTKLGALGDSVSLVTHLYLREDVIALYGFAEQAELEMFELLISVSGVGPRLALALLSTFSPDALRTAIVREDSLGLSRTPGVGKKLAARLILELRSRMPGDQRQPGVYGTSVSDDVLDALLVMGLKPDEAQHFGTLDVVVAAQTTEEKITVALQQYAARRR